jgi:hypothetical protein
MGELRSLSRTSSLPPFEGTRRLSREEGERGILERLYLRESGRQMPVVVVLAGSMKRGGGGKAFGTRPAAI